MPTAVLIWVWLCAYLNCAGWALSALHELNAGGYAIALAIWSVALFFWWKKNSAQILPQACCKKFRRRFRKPFPLAFLILAAMAFLGGAIYAPNNYDGLAYRIPRILHWLAADQWNWIHTIFPRVNQRASGIEWVSAPLIALTKTDRLLFLINIVSFLLLPGLIFSVFTKLGVRRRVAWHWMWIVPTGYCFVLQAGGIGNDLFGAPFALAAIDFALRAKKSGAARDVFSSILAAALITSAKTSGLPLLLPWAIAILPSLKIIFRRPVCTIVVCVVAAFASFLPTAILNAHYCGDWTGWQAEGNSAKNALALRTVSNTALVAVQNLTPPIFPPADAWNRAVQKTMPAGLNRRLHEIMAEPEAVELHADQMQMEEGAALGFGVVLLLLASVVAAGKISFAGNFNSAWLSAVRLTPWISLLALLSQSQVTPLGRILAPYYALLLPFLLGGTGQEKISRRRWWRISALAVFLLAGILLVVSPARPLFPRKLFLEKISALEQRHPALVRVADVYTVYRDRNDAFAPARAALEPGLKILGLITYDDPETSLWRPFGSRRIEHVRPEDTAADLKQLGIEYILVSEDAFKKHFPDPFDGWLKKMNAQTVQTIPLRLRASLGPLDWRLVKLN
jgi:hypothetical protein